MKLAALGAVSLVLGLVMSIPGLIAAGCIWVAWPLCSLHGHRLEDQAEAR